ncbi:hypothetical protein LA080_011811 [Diaporthe eres]|uniref:Uncharacterized protein n=1 Tax=Diaporthe vaccinii TaxID=105482 RepID=A0ABR4DUW5_9PEZI|nr:hypothetical protein LA080_011811 [Diaporthe eres]
MLASKAVRERGGQGSDTAPKQILTDQLFRDTIPIYIWGTRCPRHLKSGSRISREIVSYTFKINLVSP